MKQLRVIVCLILVGCFLLSSNSLFGEVVYSMDFSKMENGDATEWFKKNDFSFKNDSDEFSLRFEKGRLIIEIDDDIGGFLYKEVRIKNVKRVRIEWGVDVYPAGADWEKELYREAVGLIISFGDKKISSGSYVVPNVPYFIGLFLGELEKEGKEYTGNYFKKGGRYFCMPCNNPPGQTVITEFELSDRFKSLFKESSVPPVTAFAIEADTRDTKGKSKSFIKKIEFLSD